MIRIADVNQNQTQEVNLPMDNQIQYYNKFGRNFRDDILKAVDPSVWTTDMERQGPVFQGMKERVRKQKEYIVKYFTTDKKVLDLGCGFGRHAFMLAQSGFEIIGVDSSDIFIDIARDLFKKHRLKGEFFTGSILDFKTEEKYEQILLLDVYEHIPPKKRRTYLEYIAQTLCDLEVRLILTFPAVERYTVVGKVYNYLLKIIPFISSKEKEHPYYIPGRKDFEYACKGLFTILNYETSDTTAFFMLNKA